MRALPRDFTMNSTRADWLVPAALLALSLVPAIAGTVRLAGLASGEAMTLDNARFVAAPLPVMIHIPAAMVYSLLGAFQFAPAFCRRNRAWHRTAGRALVPSGLLVALSGLWMAHFYAWPAGDGYAVYLERMIVGVAMLVSILLALLAIRRREFTSHGEWMIRGYAIGLGAGTQVLTHLPWFMFADGAPGEAARGVMMGAGWAINVIAAEWIIHRRRSRSATGTTSEPSRHRAA